MPLLFEDFDITPSIAVAVSIKSTSRWKKQMESYGNERETIEDNESGAVNSSTGLREYSSISVYSGPAPHTRDSSNLSNEHVKGSSDLSVAMYSTNHAPYTPVKLFRN